MDVLLHVEGGCEPAVFEWEFFKGTPPTPWREVWDLEGGGGGEWGGFSTNIGYK